MLAQFYPPITGGEEHHVRTLSLELVKRGHAVAVATLWHQGMAEFEDDQGIRVYRIQGAIQKATSFFSEVGRRHAPPLPDPKLVAALRRIIARERPEIVHAHNWLAHSFLPLKRWSKANLVVTLHDYSRVCAKKSFVYEDAPCTGPYLVKCLRCAGDHYGGTKGTLTVAAHWGMRRVEDTAVDMFVAVSEATATGNGLAASQLPFTVIPNFLSSPERIPADDYQAYLSQLPDEGYLLFVGDLRRFKGIHVLLRAYEALADGPPLVLIGRQCADTPAQFPRNVVVLDHWPHPPIMEAWRRSLFALAPSVGLETFGIVAIEAMAMGRPVIASRIGGLCDVVVDGETGLLVTPGDAEALRQAIARLVDDRQLRERMGRAARQRAVMFHADTVVPVIEELYARLIQSSGQQPSDSSVRGPQ